MSLLHDLLEHFVMAARDPPPADHEDVVRPDDGPVRACADPAPRTPPGIAVLSAAADAQALGAGLGLALARHRRAPVAAVCVWTGDVETRTGWRAPALPAARRLAATLAARGHDARATGRLAVVRLPTPAGDAAAGARRAAGAAGAAPTVLALGGPRDAAFDDLLAVQDLVVVATPRGTQPTLARLAVAGLAPATAGACACEVPPGAGARVLATAGLTLLPSARRALAGAVEELS
jgi:hypothetical protein